MARPRAVSTVPDEDDAPSGAGQPAPLRRVAAASAAPVPVLPDAGVWIVIPCYRVGDHIGTVLAGVPPWVEGVVCVDDACPDGSADTIESSVVDPRVRVVRLPENRGVGGATMAGYEEAVRLGARVLVKVDGDGQMDLRHLPALVMPIVLGEADYTKGNRFASVGRLREMPRHRIFGNALLSFFAKVSTGYWNLFDPTNGYTALDAAVARRLLEKDVQRRYLFETDLLYHLGTLRAVVQDVPMPARYGTETSGLRAGALILPLLWLHLRNAVRRIVGQYFVRDLSVASLELVAGLAACGFGVGYALYWVSIRAPDEAAPAGVVMAAAVPGVLGVQLLLQALNYDVSSVPTRPIGPRLHVLDELADGDAQNWK